MHNGREATAYVQSSGFPPMVDDILVTIDCAFLGNGLIRCVEVKKATLSVMGEPAAVIRVAVLSEKTARLPPIAAVCLRVTHYL